MILKYTIFFFLKLKYEFAQKHDIKEAIVIRMCHLPS